MLSIQKLATSVARNVLGVRNLSLTAARLREVEDRKEMLKSLPTKDEGTAGEKVLDIDTMITQQVSQLFEI